MSLGKVFINYETGSGKKITKEIMFVPPPRLLHEPADEFIIRVDKEAYLSVSRSIRPLLTEPVKWKTDLGYRNF